MKKKVRKSKPKTHEGVKPRDFSIVGMEYRVTLPYRRRLAMQTPFPIRLVREPANPHDENAIAVTIAGGTFIDGMKIGYLRRQVAEVLAPALDEGDAFVLKAEVSVIEPEISEAVAEIWLKHKENLTLDKFPT